MINSATIETKKLSIGINMSGDFDKTTDRINDNSLKGYFERADKTAISCWVFDPLHPEHRFAVAVEINGIFRYEGIAAQFRQDLLEAKMGDGYYGFLVAHQFMPELDDRNSNISIWLPEISQYLDGSPRVIEASPDVNLDTFDKNTRLIGFLERADRKSVSCWVFNRDAPGERVNVQVEIDGAIGWVGRASYPREDLVTLGLGDGCHGLLLDTNWLVNVPSTAFNLEVRSTQTGQLLPGGPFRVAALTEVGKSESAEVHKPKWVKAAVGSENASPDKNEFSTYLTKARTAVSRHRWVEACGWFEKLLARQELSREVTLEYSRCLNRTGNHEAALKQFLLCMSQKNAANRIAARRIDNHPFGDKNDVVGEVSSMIYKFLDAPKFESEFQYIVLNGRINSLLDCSSTLFTQTVDNNSPSAYRHTVGNALMPESIRRRQIVGFVRTADELANKRQYAQAALYHEEALALNPHDADLVENYRSILRQSERDEELIEFDRLFKDKA